MEVVQCDLLMRQDLFSLTSNTTVVLTNVSGTFKHMKNRVSDSAETDSIVENSSNTDLTISNVVTPLQKQDQCLWMMLIRIKILLTLY